MLEVATLRYRRTFNLTYELTILRLPVPFCRESASFTVDTYTTYRTRLARRWLAEFYQGRVLITAPPLEPALPVAFDTSRFKDSFSSCLLFPSLDTQRDLLRSISGQLKQAALSPEQISFVKDHGVHGGARDTVREFTRKWLLTQKGYKIPDGAPIDVVFAGDRP